MSDLIYMGELDKLKTSLCAIGILTRNGNIKMFRFILMRNPGRENNLEMKEHKESKRMNKTINCVVFFCDLKVANINANT